LMLCVRAARARRRRGQQRKAAASRERPGSLRDLANVQTSLASVFTKGIRPRARRTVRSAGSPRDGVFGIDFWHAVEFSRSGRAPKTGLSAGRRGNPSNLAAGLGPVKSAGPRPSPAREPKDDRRTAVRIEHREPAPGPATEVSVAPCRAAGR